MLVNDYDQAVRNAVERTRKAAKSVHRDADKSDDTGAPEADELVREKSASKADDSASSHWTLAARVRAPAYTTPVRIENGGGRPAVCGFAARLEQYIVTNLPSEKLTSINSVKVRTFLVRLDVPKSVADHDLQVLVCSLSVTGRFSAVRRHTAMQPELPQSTPLRLGHDQHRRS
jgi:hypothetical protein